MNEQQMMALIKAMRMGGGTGAKIATALKDSGCTIEAARVALLQDGYTATIQPGDDYDILCISNQPAETGLEALTSIEHKDDLPQVVWPKTTVKPTSTGRKRKKR